MTNPVPRRTLLTGTAAALTAASVVGVGESPAAATAPAPYPLVPLRIPKLDQGMWQQPDATVQWLRDTRLGMFIHWGVYAGPAHGEWYMHSAAITPAAYQTFVTQASPQQFAADAYKPADWAALAKQLGAGNPATRLSSAFSDPQWLQVDLGSVQSIGRVVLSWENAYGKAYQIQTSNDGSTWTTIYSTTTGTGRVDDLTGLNGSGRYVRVYGTVRGTQWSHSLWSMQVFTS